MTIQFYYCMYACKDCFISSVPLCYHPSASSGAECSPLLLSPYTTCLHSHTYKRHSHAHTFPHLIRIAYTYTPSGAAQHNSHNAHSAHSHSTSQHSQPNRNQGNQMVQDLHSPMQRKQDAHNMHMRPGQQWRQHGKGESCCVLAL